MNFRFRVGFYFLKSHEPHLGNDLLVSVHLGVRALTKLSAHNLYLEK